MIVNVTQECNMSKGLKLCFSYFCLKVFLCVDQVSNLSQQNLPLETQLSCDHLLYCKILEMDFFLTLARDRPVFASGIFMCEVWKTTGGLLEHEASLGKEYTTHGPL